MFGMLQGKVLYKYIYVDESKNMFGILQGKVLYKYI